MTFSRDSCAISDHAESPTMKKGRPLASMRWRWGGSMLRGNATASVGAGAVLFGCGDPPVLETEGADVAS